MTTIKIGSKILIMLFRYLFFLNFFTSLSVKRILLIQKPTFFVFIIHKNIPNGKTLFFPVSSQLGTL